MQETWVWSLGPEEPLEKRMVTHSSIRAWRIPWTEEPGGLQSRGCKELDTTEWLIHTCLLFWVLFLFSKMWWYSEAIGRNPTNVGEQEPPRTRDKGRNLVYFSDFYISSWCDLWPSSFLDLHSAGYIIKCTGRNREKLASTGTWSWVLGSICVALTSSRILAWKIPWTKKPGGLQFMGLQKVRHDWQ